ncbi:fused MFS/spermidine synthase [Georgenia daeguensis]|uniref:Spermidine synthase n=1 Tax=Georgenia daeguensis TaxID=908355 RepID=A0ABP8EQV4_9MICO
MASALLAAGSGRESLWLRRRYGAKFAWFLEAATATLVLVAATAATFALQDSLWVIAALTVSFMGALFIARRPIPLAAAMVVVFVGLTMSGPDTVYRERTFYGSYKVTEQDGVRKLAHGTTLHGSQFIGANATTPTTYYSRTGPVGDIFREYDNFDDIAVVGLGTGTIAAYGEADQSLTFYEIDPKVVDIARDPRFFTYLVDAAAKVQTEVGDGRLSLAGAAKGSYELIVLDAFSSDSIPVHLLTQEAFEVYADALAPDGVLMVHVSNRIFDLEPVVAGSGSHIGWAVAVGFGEADGDRATPSEWIALAPSAKDLEPLLRLGNWRPARAETLLWTDDYSSVLTALR